MKTFRLPSMWLLLGPGLLTGLLALVIVAAPNFTILRSLLGFIWLFVLPGALILRLTKLRPDSAWETAGLIAGFSLLADMGGALLTNAGLLLVGYQHPLATIPLMTGLSLAWGGLAFANWRRSRHQTLQLRIPVVSRSTTLTVLAGLPVVALSILGAITLNNGGTNLLIMTMLLYSLAYLGVLVVRRDKLPEGALLSGLYMVGLALLLMTSLRGWFTTGHDIQREYRVFALALTSLKWDPAAYHDAYNACLSITLLPTAIKQILGIEPSFVFKTVFQALFALVPVIIYLISRRFTPRLVALLAAVYFMAFPTFFQDMPMLNRQEIAFLFMGLVYMVVFNPNWSLKIRRRLAIVFGLGVVLSHYSTTYTMLALFLGIVAIGFVLKAFNRANVKTSIKAAWDRLNVDLRWQPTAINLLVVVTLLGVSYIWSSQLTNTGGNLSRIAVATLDNIRHGLKDDTKSSDTNYSLFGKAKLSDAERLQRFDAKTVPELRSELPTPDLYTTDQYAAYPVTLAKADQLPLTPAGQALQNTGIDVPALNAATRQGSALFLQLMLLFGIALLFFSRPLTGRQIHEYRLFQLASVGLLAAIIALPVLSAEYGLLRAFQQILMLSGATIVIATIALVPKHLKRLAVVIPTAIALAFFASSTGVITTLLGGYPAQIHLANSGKYYDLFYPHRSEQLGAYWLEDQLDHPSLVGEVVSTYETDRFFQGDHHLQIDLPRDTAYPGTLRKSSYVLLGYTALNKQQDHIYHNGDDITYTYPVEFLDANKNLLYASQGTRVYK